MALKVSIIGAAGTLGACTAFRLATLGLADELVMLDQKENMLASHHYDIETSVTGMHDLNIRIGRDEDLAGSDIVIITAGAPWRVVSSRMEKLAENLPIIKDITAKVTTYCPEAVVITTTNPVDPLNLAMQHYSGLPRERLIGYTLNDTTRFLKLTAKALRVPSTRLTGTVIGEHGDSAVLLFSSLRLDGKPVTVDADMQTRIGDDLRNTLKASIALRTGWTSGWTSSVGLARLVAAISGKSDEALPCSIILQGEYGLEGISLSLPVRLGLQGVQEVVGVDMNRQEADKLEQSAAYLVGIKQEMAKVLDA